jgi:hypothetical protein
VFGGGYVHRFPWSGLTCCRTELVEVLVGWAVGLERGTPRSGGWPSQLRQQRARHGLLPGTGTRDSVERGRRDAGENSRCRDRSRCRGRSEQGSPQEAKSSHCPFLSRASGTKYRLGQPVSRWQPWPLRQRTGRPTGGGYVQSSSRSSVDGVEDDAAGAAGANALFPQIGPVRENARTDIVLAPRPRSRTPRRPRPEGRGLTCAAGRDGRAYGRPDRTVESNCTRSGPRRGGRGPPFRAGASRTVVGPAARFLSRTRGGQTGD